MYRATIYRGADGFAALSEEWSRLEARVAHPRYFHFYGWWRGYATVLADRAALFIVVVRDAERPVAIVPLERRTRRFAMFTVRELLLPQHDHVPLVDIVCDASASGPEIMRAVREVLNADERWDILGFRNVLAESDVVRRLAADQRCLRTVSHTCDYVDCARPYEEIVAGFSRNFRSNLSKARNKLARERDVEFASAAEPAALEAAFGEFLDVEASGWKGAAGTAIKQHPELVNYYRTLMHDLAPRGAVVINTLRIAGRPIAVQFCVRDSETLYIVKLAYDERWAQVAPGNMLVEWVIKQAGRAPGFRYLNLVNDPPWFKAWQPACDDVYYVRVFNRTFAGWLAFALLAARARLKAMRAQRARQGQDAPDLKAGKAAAG